MEQSVANTWSEWFDEKYRALAQFARPADKPTLSDDDLGFQQHTVELFAQALAEGQIRLSATLILESPDCPTSVSSIMYYIHLTAGDWTYMAIIQRRTISEKLDGDQLSAEFGKPRILERAARRGPWERHEEKLRKRFKVLIGRAGAGVITLENGDFMALNGTGDLRISG
jgi:hypothetical protein